MSDTIEVGSHAFSKLEDLAPPPPLATTLVRATAMRCLTPHQVSQSIKLKSA
jgi:hypothetical protein